MIKAEKIISILRNVPKNKDGAISRKNLDRHILKRGTDLEKLLGFLAKKEYIFHGSKKLYKIIKPQKSHRISGETISAIYATKIPSIAIYYAMISRSTHKIVHGKKFYNKHKNNNKGYIYILRRNDFEKNNDENFLCRKKVEPEFIFECRFDDFYNNLKKEKINWKKAGEIILQNYIHSSAVHNVKHVLKTVRNSSIIAKSVCPEKIDDVKMGALLHDIGRVDDFDRESTHAQKGAAIAYEILAKYFRNAPLDFKKILFAVKYHSRGKISRDPVIGAIWDGDRLDLERVGMKVNPKYLSTKKAKEIMRSRLIEKLKNISS
ncbi:MAG: HD domain-containing protein [Parcubacteria group bacterium]|jgi:uncharacterized protein